VFPAGAYVLTSFKLWVAQTVRCTVLPDVLPPALPYKEGQDRKKNILPQSRKSRKRKEKEGAWGDFSVTYRALFMAQKNCRQKRERD
jgi:hypothetical protein